MLIFVALMAKERVETKNIQAQNDQDQEEKWPSYTMVEKHMRRIYFKFYKETYKGSEIERKTKELIAIAASLGFGCAGCLEGHLKKALQYGATKEEISVAISIAMGVAAASVVDQTDSAAEKLQIKHFD
ncbi:carboxymuconolactone decarboxylase family protein [Acidobacteria bacterium AH-259-A15]|nr:carboxymuconolactone decarboxylase family protein [Acidobacteria bacterium AH-259-A15]